MAELKTIFINVNSIISKHRRHYLQIFVDRHKQDILFIAEHHLSQKHRFELRKYKSHRQNRIGQIRGGTVIFLKENIKYENIHMELTCMEGTAVKVRKNNGVDIYIFSLYCRPQTIIETIDLDTIADIIGTKEAIIGADLNAKNIIW